MSTCTDARECVFAQSLRQNRSARKPTEEEVSGGVGDERLAFSLSLASSFGSSSLAEVALASDCVERRGTAGFARVLGEAFGED
jgi:hypothetical protein